MRRSRLVHQVAPWTRWGWLLAGAILIAIHVALLAISPRFAYGELPVLDRPIWLLVALMMVAGAVYLSAIWLLKIPARPARGWWVWIIVIGLAMRALMFVSTPMLETDYYRYLWDGGVLAIGQSPYAHAPLDVHSGNAPVEFIELGRSSGLVLERVNHPSLTTIYPPTAQGFFAAAHTVVPWRIEGLRTIWSVLDLVTFGMLIGLLRDLRLPTAAAVIYWWNPLLIKEAYNSAHMEVVVLTFVIAAAWLAVRFRSVGGAIVLALAAGAKLWPALLFPALVRQRGVGWRAIGIAAGAFIVGSALLLSPMFAANLGETAGVRAYSETWEVNDLLFRGIHAATTWVASEARPETARLVARLVVGVILFAWIAWLCRRPADDGRGVCERALWIIGALFLLAPAAYPWYWLWMLPLLAVRPSPGLLILTMTLPLYCLRFPLREVGADAWFDYGVVPLEFAPAFALLAWEGFRRWSFATAPRLEMEVLLET